jgi:hypothetical protein
VNSEILSHDSVDRREQSRLEMWWRSALRWCYGGDRRYGGVTVEIGATDATERECVSIARWFCENVFFCFSNKKVVFFFGELTKKILI